jgi:uncharacterized protein (DUF433 family)
VTKRVTTEHSSDPADESALLGRIVSDPTAFGGKPTVRGHRLAVEHVPAMLAAGDATSDILREHPGLDRDDVRACLVYARRVVAGERVEPRLLAG